MADSNTYTQIHIHCIFAPKYRLGLIDVSWKEELHKYISAIVQNNKHKMVGINSMPDHLHMFFGMRTHQSLADLMNQVKGDSSKWINNQKFCKGKFNWQLLPTGRPSGPLGTDIDPGCYRQIGPLGH